MDARQHVGLALLRTVRRPGMWPAHDLGVFRNQLLDEAGGDHRIHVSFLVHLAELSVPAAITEALGAGATPWETPRRRLVLRLTTEHFLQPDMAAWGVECWGAALGVPDAVIGPPVGEGASPSGTPPTVARSAAAAALAPPNAARTVARGSRGPAAAGATRTRGTPRPSGAAHTTPGAPGMAIAAVPSWVKPGKVPAVPRWIPGSNVAAHGVLAAPGIQGVERNALIALASLLTLAALVVHLTGSSDSRTPAGSGDAAAAPAPGAMAVNGDGGAAERFRVVVLRSTVDGEARCSAVAARIRWHDERLEDVRISGDGRRFAFLGRPGLEGTIAADGAITSRVVESERDGTRSAFRLWGQMTPTGFRAVAETRTTTLLRWREELTCRFVAEVEGARLPPPPARP